MKIRTDFVTNSSSSSFITFTIKNKKLADILKEYESVYDIQLSINDDVVTGSLLNDESLGINDLEDCGVAESIAGLIEYFNERYFDFDESYRQEIDELIGNIRLNEYDINSDLQEAEIFDVESITDGDGSSYTHTVYKNGKYKTLILDDNLSEYEDAANGTNQFLWELINNNLTNIDFLEKIAQKNGRWVTKNDYTPSDNGSVVDVEPHILEMIMDFLYDLTVDEIIFLKNELGRWYEYASSVKVGNKEDLPHEIFRILMYEMKSDSRLNNKGCQCLVMLQEEIAYYHLIKDFEKYINDDERIVFKDKIFAFKKSTSEIDDKYLVETAGGVYRTNISKQTNYFVVDDDWINSKSFFDATIHELIEYLHKDTPIKVVTRSNFKKQLGQNGHNENEITEMVRSAKHRLLEAGHVFDSLINTVDVLKCNGKYFCTTYLDDYEEEINHMLYEYGAERKETMSKKIGIFIIENKYIGSWKVEKAKELIAEGQEMVIVTYKYLCDLYDAGKVQR